MSSISNTVVFASKLVHINKNIWMNILAIPNRSFMLYLYTLLLLFSRNILTWRKKIKEEMKQKDEKDEKK